MFVERVADPDPPSFVAGEGAESLPAGRQALPRRSFILFLMVDLCGPKFLWKLIGIWDRANFSFLSAGRKALKKIGSRAFV